MTTSRRASGRPEWAWREAAVADRGDYLVPEEARIVLAQVVATR